MKLITVTVPCYNSAAYMERCVNSLLPGGEEINPELPASRPFPYPYSMPNLRAVKAAEFQGGMAAHERMHDRLQRAH